MMNQKITSEISYASLIINHKRQEGFENGNTNHEDVIWNLNRTAKKARGIGSRSVELTPKEHPQQASNHRPCLHMLAHIQSN